MGIVEKLGIEPLMAVVYQSTTVGEINSFDLIDVRNLEQQRNEMLKALIDEAKYPLEDGSPNWTMIKLIEAACYPKTWQEIKELSNG